MYYFLQLQIQVTFIQNVKLKKFQFYLNKNFKTNTTIILCLLIEKATNYNEIKM